MLPIFTFVVCWIPIPTSLYTILEVSAVRRLMHVYCGSRWGRCVLFINIWDSLTASCVVYNTAMYTLYGRCSQCGRCMFIHWPVRPVHGLYGPRRRCRTGCAKQGTGCPWNLWSLKFPAWIPRNFEDFPKCHFFLDSDSSILPKIRLFLITFWWTFWTALISEHLSYILNSWNYRMTY